jgi:hypothetical protein
MPLRRRIALVVRRGLHRSWARRGILHAGRRRRRRRRRATPATLKHAQQILARW